MKATQITELLANIKATFVSFFSIFMFAALGVGVFLGISWAGPALEDAAQGMFDEGAFHNYQIQYPYGLTADDLEQLSAIEGVSHIEAERQSFQTTQIGDRKCTVKVQSLGQDIDVPLIVEGTLPAQPDEIAFHAESAKVLGVSVGDTIAFEKDAEDNGDGKSKDAKDGNDSGMEYLTEGTFKVTALVDSAEYVAKSNATYGYSSSPSGAVDALAWVVDDVFVPSAFQDGYPVVNVVCDSLAGKHTFGDDYKQSSKTVMEPIEALGSTLAPARYDDLHGQVQKQVDEGQAKLDDAEKQIADGEKKVADGKKKLIDGRKELKTKRAEGQAKLDRSYQQLMSAEAKKANAERKLADARAKVNKGQRDIDEVDRGILAGKKEVGSASNYKSSCDRDLAKGKITKKEYNKRLDKRGAQANAKMKPLKSKYGMKIPNINHSNYSDALNVAGVALANSEDLEVTIDGRKTTLRKERKRLASAKSQLASAESTYGKQVAKLNSGWAQYNNGKATFDREIAAAEQQLSEGEAKLNDARAQIKEAKKKVAENKPILEDAKAKLAAMQRYDWTVLPRAYNAGVGEVSTFSTVTNNLSISMAALFVIVGLLVSYFAVSRIVREQITQIGTKKALGFRQREITTSYLLYSGIAVLAGAIVGAIVGYLVVEGIIGGVLAGMFAFGEYPPYFGWGLFLIITAIELVLVLGATYLACRSILKQHAVELLRGEKPPTGKTRFYEKWGIWDKLPLFVQTIVNNCVNDRRRVLSTIVGVAGCTALIVTAITLNNDVMKSYDRHYEDVYGFNAITYVDPDVEGAIDKIETALEGEGIATAQAFKKSYLMEQPNGESGSMRIAVPVDEEAFAQLYRVNTVEGSAFDLSAEGAWVSRAYAEHFGAKVGDTVAIEGEDGITHMVPILGFSEFLLTYHEMVVPKAYFEREFGSFSPNVLLCQTGETPVQDVKQTISGIAGFDSIIDDAAVQYEDFATFSSVSSAVVAIYLVLATLMAIVVLLNLNVMFIDEKKRELIVLMINGFSVKDARHYISYDNIVLTVLGIIVGIILGCIMGSVTVLSIEPMTASFVKDVDAMAVVIGIVGSALLAIIMALIALRRINNFKLTDINRF